MSRPAAKTRARVEPPHHAETSAEHAVAQRDPAGADVLTEAMADLPSAASQAALSGGGNPLDGPAQSIKHTVLGWQRSVGNAETVRRVSQMRGPGAARGRVQRFEGREHRSLGAAGSGGRDFPAGALFPGSPPLTYGEVVALSGDFYGSFDDMASPYFVKYDAKKMETPGVLPETVVDDNASMQGTSIKSREESRQRKIAELVSLKHLLDLEQAAGQKGDEEFLKNLDSEYVMDGGKAIPGYDILTEGRYGKLALTNFRHFSVGAPGMTNVDTWRAEHQKALVEAWSAGLRKDEAGLNKAMMRNAASDHYLTDAFSSGHMRTPRQAIDAYYRNLAQGLAEKLPEYVASGIPSSISVSVPLSQVRNYLPSGTPELPDISISIPIPLADALKDKIASIGPALGAKMRPYLYGFIGVAIGGLVAKWLHDRDNEAGVMVRSKAHPEPWRAFGDDYLEKNDAGAKINEAEAIKAVKADSDEVQKMYDQGVAASSKLTGQGKQGKNPTSGAGTAIPKQIFFNFDRPRGEDSVGDIPAGTRAGLTALAEYLRTHDGVTVSMRGWADSRGAPEYNGKLSMRRISAVRAFLLQAGVKPEKIGALEPMGPPPLPSTSATHAQWRRVDIQVNGTPTPAAQGPENGPGSQGGQGGQNGQGEQGVEVPPMPAIGEFAAQKYIPEVIGDQNAPLPKWKWPEIQDATLRQEVTAKAKKMVHGVLGGMLEKEIQDKIPETYPVRAKLPIIGEVGFDLKLQPYAHTIKKKVIEGVESELDKHFAEALDFAATVTGGGDAAAAEDQGAAPPQ